MTPSIVRLTLDLLIGFPEKENMFFTTGMNADQSGLITQYWLVLKLFAIVSF
jgi:hypothetical protein